MFCCVAPLTKGLEPRWWLENSSRGQKAGRSCPQQDGGSLKKKSEGIRPLIREVPLCLSHFSPRAPPRRWSSHLLSLHRFRIQTESH